MRSRDVQKKEPATRKNAGRKLHKRLFVNVEGESVKVEKTDGPCPILSQCRACPLIEKPYKEQLEDKTEDFRKLLASSRGYFSQLEVKTCQPSPQRFNYRNIAKLVISEKKGAGGKRWIDIGLYEPESHRVIDIKSCPVQSRIINRVVGWFRTNIWKYGVEIKGPMQQNGLRYIVLKSSRDGKQCVVTLVDTNDAQRSTLRKLSRELCREFPQVKGLSIHFNSTEGNAIFDYSQSKEDLQLSGQNLLTEAYGEVTYKYSSTSFSQINPYVAQEAYNRILDLVQPEAGETALDLYCGVGSIALQLANYVKLVVGVEETPSSISDAKTNAADNGLKNALFYEGRVEEVLQESRVSQSLANVDIVTLNPSRRGAQPEALRQIANLKPSRIAYMSCSAETLIRDLKILEELGYYARHIELLDMFPGTPHYESVTLLTQ